MNPPFGVDWKHYGESIKEEHEEKGKDGRYGAGLPRTSDGSLLFLQHMISKMKRDEKGSRMAIILMVHLYSLAMLAVVKVKFVVG